MYLQHKRMSEQKEQKQSPVIVKSAVSTILYLAVFAGMVACLYNVFKITENDMSLDEAFCKSGYIGYEYNIHHEHFERANMSSVECLDRFGFQHSLLYRNSYSVEVSLWTSLGFSVAALLFLIFSAVCFTKQCAGWQTIGGDKDYNGGKGSCESAMFCCGAAKGINGRPRFSWARRATFFALAFGALICLGISLCVVVIAFAQETQFVPQIMDDSRKDIPEADDSSVRRVDNLKALLTLHIIAMVFKVAWILAVDDDQRTMMHLSEYALHNNVNQNKNGIDANNKLISENTNDIGKNKDGIAANGRRINTNEQSIRGLSKESTEKAPDAPLTKLYLPYRRTNFNRNGYKNNRSYMRNQLNY